MAGKFGLGKGLGALLPSDEPQGVIELTTDQITFSPYQPRTTLNESALEELAQSIKKSGIIQPIVVRHTKTGGYELIAGERRLRAARLAGFERVPVVIREISDHDAAEFGLVENIQREDLNPIDIARAMKRLKDEFSYTQESIAEGIKKSRPYVANLLRLLDLPETVQNAILSGKISEGHGRTLLTLKDHEQILTMMNRVIVSNLSVRETEKAVKKAMEAVPPKTKDDPPAKERTADIILAENLLRDKLSTKVKVMPSTIVIEYYSKEDLERICEAIAG